MTPGGKMAGSHLLIVLTDGTDGRGGRSGIRRGIKRRYLQVHFFLRSVAYDQLLQPAHFAGIWQDRKSTRLNSSHGYISYAVFCLKKKKKPVFTLLLHKQLKKLLPNQ